jgi:hypothetical protein
MTKYRIAGANATTGKDIEIEVEAETESEALDDAQRRGIFVSSVEEITRAAPSKIAAPSPSSMGTGKLFVIITGGVACGLTLALIFYAVFFAAAGTGKQKGYSAKSNLGWREQAFVTAIQSGDADMVRQYLVDPLNWQEVATPALQEVISGEKLEVSSYESDEGRRERQFWNDLSERLIKNGADVNATMQDALDIDSLRFLIAHKANVNAPDVTGDTLLHRRADDVWEDSVALLIASGANVNAVGYGGNTPLHCAAKNGAVKVINMLLKAGASINTKNSAGQTPLKIANLAMREDAAAELKSHGGTE